MFNLKSSAGKMRRLVGVASLVAPESTSTPPYRHTLAEHRGRLGITQVLRLSSPLLLAAALLALMVFFVQDTRSVSAQTGTQAVEVPGPVTALSLSSTPNSVTVRWEAPDSGGDPKRYIVHVRPKDGDVGSGKTKTPKAKKTSVTFDNLGPGATYKVWVRAKNEVGKGERVRAAITLPEDESLPQSTERPVKVVRCEEYHSPAYCESFR